MKTRSGFVSNSSSSSFVIVKKYLSQHQIELIENHIEEAQKRFSKGTYSQQGHCGDEWIIHTDDYELEGYTDMNNFNMKDYLEKVAKVDQEYIKWSH